MTHKELRAIIKEYIRDMVESDGYPIMLTRTDTPVHPVDANRNSLVNLPGAPFGGRLDASQLVTLPNEARDVLRKWAKLCDLACKKHGSPDAWPALVKQTALELGRQFEDHISNTSPHSTNGPDAGNLPI